MNPIYQQMLSAYDMSLEVQRRQAPYEVNQQLILAGLYRGGFFEKAAFYGGTCLRIFHGLQRFSEDMDFSLLSRDDDFDFTRYCQPVIDTFALVGREVTIQNKDKRTLGKVESAFLKDNTDVYNLSFQTEKTVKVKIEVDTNPPLGFHTEQKLLLMPSSFMTRCVCLPDLYAGKMHALVYRAWKTRIKGRDWYDFEHYVRHQVPLHYEHLKQRILQFNGELLSKEDFMCKLRERLSSADIESVKQDVVPFVWNADELKIWSNDYFLQLADRIQWV